MIKTEFLIIGQGISGTFLTWHLHQRKRSFITIDNNHPDVASRIAAGIINPVTGRRIVQTWMIDILLPYAYRAYQQLGEDLQLEAISQKDIIDFFPSVQMLQAFTERINEDPKYLQTPSYPQQFQPYFNYDFGYGIISPAYAVNLAEIIPAWRKKLLQLQQLVEEEFHADELIINDNNIVYRDITADKIIFCDGAQGAQNPWFSKLPFAANKGQALIIRNSAIPRQNIFKKGITIVPVKDDFFWIGSSYEWDFENIYPSEDFLTRTTSQLRSWLKSPFTIEAHLATLRPATLERRPFVGLHPLHPQIGIFNGMGTKGCSLSPYFANQFVNYLIDKQPILPEADVTRFSKILSR